MKKINKIIALLLLAGLVGFTGCRTAEGFGEDVERAGEEIQEGVQ